ncbi:MAG: PAS domain S-box protein [Methanoregula sp.]|jgi:PAS domain S-box-containing protein
MYSILYVDDDQNLLVINKVFLEKTGDFTVTTTHSAKKALDLIAEGQYDAILSDYQMPEMDGIELLKQIRSRFDNLPFILFTGRGREEIAIEALNNGADFYIQKGPDMKGMLVELQHKLCHAIERRLTEKALQESRQLQKDIINFLPDATFVIDALGKIVAWNNALEEMTGLSGDEMMGKCRYEYAIPFFGRPRLLLIDQVHEEHPEIEKEYLYFERRGKTIQAEISLPLLRGNKDQYLWLTAGPLYDLGGNLTGAIESIRDMTEVQKIRHDLVMSRKMNAGFAEMMPVAVYEMDLSGTLTYANSLAYSWFGIDGENIPEKICIFDYIVPEDRMRAARDIRGIIEGAKSVGQEYLLVRTDGSTFPALIYASQVLDPDFGKCSGVRGIIADITEQKKIARALQDSQERLKLAVKVGDIGIWDITLPDKKIREIGEWLSRTLGFVEFGHEPVSIDVGERLLSPEDLSRLKAAYREHVRAGTGQFESEARISSRDGSPKLLLIQGKVIEYDRCGSPLRITGTVNDITRNRVRMCP